MENSETLPFIVSTENGDLSKNKNVETLPDFQKDKIQEAFVDVDCQLKQLAQNYDNLSKVRRLITIQEIRNRLFEVCNLCVHDMDVRRFASHGPGDKTPLNSECC
jgi:uncharacterized Fe-S radical SAM superfamily protein PflX